MTTDDGDHLQGNLPAGESPGLVNGSMGLPNVLMRIPVSVQVVIGTASIPLSRVTQLVPGTILPLDEKLGTPARMLVNGREVARGNLLVVDEALGKLGLSITELTGENSGD